ncbi:RagB/SusD family nutrient uptake outer membrane protein [Pseudoflavitalea sp. G-6-1-2]|uniref:RagB/SusD family nutrient uptake outer membrane protein n=1 Tax=Pseudoflavitalea sp. G-6-1-2 TaxID=2728841 RepID=UPI00146A0908|nr:RagB/SusD family nutrient uptake outer membrane protein [Pseudoflavitalea sp. G-6-1-2]NML22332.1 RagB/SusD family nutrient uptake outer membrane protein [Pseudoflavitalea sp. G-6-1-2]
MKKLSIIVAATALLSAGGCKKYLEEEPSRVASIKSVDQLEALLNNAGRFVTENNYTSTWSTDDAEIPASAYKASSGQFTPETIYSYLFTTDQMQNNMASDPLWSGEFSKIFNVNLTLSYIDKVSGSEEAKQRLKADAHFIRAYSNWVLANYYCLPYTAANEGSKGLPLKKTIGYTESLKRATLKETYDFILADIAEAQKTNVDDVDPKAPWRASKKAIAAFLSRYYLFLGNYDKAIEQADLALSTSTVKLKDFKTLAAGTPVNYKNPDVLINFSELNDWTAAKYYYWPEFFYLRFAYTPGWWYLPSASLVSLYDQSNDLRFKWLMFPQGGRYFSPGTANLYRYGMFQDMSYLPSAPTIAEVLLNKAEALARKNDAAGAMSAVNLLRDKRMNTVSPLAASTKEEAIQKVLEERRREMPFVMRWYDIRRFSVNDYPADDVVITRNFFQINGSVVNTEVPQTYTLPVGSKRYAVPINGVELDAARGQLEQNDY